MQPSSEGSRKADFGDLVANLMRQNASPRPVGKEIGTGTRVSEVRDEATQENGNESPEAKKKARLASLGFLRGATLRRRGRIDASM